MPRPDALEWLALREPQPVRELVDPPRGLRGLHLDGVAVEVWPGLLRAVDLGVSPSDRARAVRGDVPSGAVLARRSALWVHTGAFRPAELDVVAPGRRGSTPRARVHSELLGPADVMGLGGVAVTSLERTAVDVARWGPPDAVASWLAVLAQAGLRAEVVAETLEAASGRPGVVRARALLAAAGLTPARRPPPRVSVGWSDEPGRDAGSSPAWPGVPHP